MKSIKKYIPRILEKELIAAAKEFPVLTLTGPRQTGKSTLLQKIFPNHFYVTLDDPLARKMATEDSNLFLSHSKMIIDEIQYLPELLPFIKMAVDKDRGNNGRFLLTGSQYFPLMSGLGESLAGRVALYELLGFSGEEIPEMKKGDDLDSLFSMLFRGFFPDPLIHLVDRNRFYAAYLQTYLERDIRQIASVQDLRVFQNFLELLAARAGALLNLNEISKECGVSFSSAKRWLSLLESTRIVYLLRPYAKNVGRRVIKSPKLYFTDTGLLAYLLRYPDPLTMRTSPQAGAFLENFVMEEILKYKFNHHENFEIYFYRDSNHKEVDVLLDYGLFINCVEIKLTTTPREEHFVTLRKVVAGFKNAKGYFISGAGAKSKLTESVEMLPWNQVRDCLSGK